MKENLNIIILAAGQGKRLNSELPKPLNTLAKKPFIFYILETAIKMNPDNIYIIKGYMGNILENAVTLHFPDIKISWIEQKETLGTAHAVKLASDKITPTGNTLILYGDIPLIGEKILNSLVLSNNNYSLSILTCKINNPKGYGRIVRKNNRIKSIVEEKDASIEEKLISEINTGIMIISSKVLISLIGKINNNNAQKEYYLTDIVDLIDNNKINSVTTDDEMQISGINTMEQLADLEILHQKRTRSKLAKNGIHMVDKNSLYIFGDIEHKKDIFIEPNVVLENVSLESNIKIGFGSVIKNSTIKSNTIIHPYSIIDNSEIEESVNIGPFSRLRPGSKLQRGSKVGNFVEIKNSTIKESSKISHLSYIGDSKIGSNTNIGAGTITCNYDGENKFETNIGDNSFIGSNTTLIAPVSVGNNSFVAAGSVISKNIKSNEFGITRTQQVNKLNKKAYNENN
ncbi:MAG: bifunctional UDP-N-acetylglucosamine diphosphorylase/glucosamine-1-phosphate N-acetyltransferase GlmU [Psittacicella sp.]